MDKNQDNNDGIKKLNVQNKALKKLLNTLDKKQKEIIIKKQKHEKA